MIFSLLIGNKAKRTYSVEFITNNLEYSLSPNTIPMIIMNITNKKLYIDQTEENKAYIDDEIMDMHKNYEDSLMIHEGSAPLLHSPKINQNILTTKNNELEEFESLEKIILAEDNKDSYISVQKRYKSLAFSIIIHSIKNFAKQTNFRRRIAAQTIARSMLEWHKKIAKNLIVHKNHCAKVIQEYYRTYSCQNHKKIINKESGIEIQVKELKSDINDYSGTKSDCQVLKAVNPFALDEFDQFSDDLGDTDEHSVNQVPRMMPNNTTGRFIRFEKFIEIPCPEEEGIPNKNFKDKNYVKQSKFYATKYTDNIKEEKIREFHTNDEVIDKLNYTKLLLEQESNDPCKLIRSIDLELLVQKHSQNDRYSPLSSINSTKAKQQTKESSEIKRFTAEELHKIYFKYHHDDQSICSIIIRYRNLL